ncbi:MAG: DNA primase [Kiritimatiellaeota bacterium]|nr:DNA primase [Kiritimatiellota bacterium]
MANIIPKNLLEEIRARNDIADVVGGYLQLKHVGSALKALCPFHKEKTPSFHVNPQRQIFHCFGCGEGGDVFKFVMKYENVDFAAAARLLAERCGLRLEYAEGGERGDGTDKPRLYKLHEEVALLYHSFLTEGPQGAPARDYLAQRELDLETAREFLIGYAPERWDTLLLWAAKKKIAPQLLEAAGLVLKSDRAENRSPYYDRFRHRLMFAIRDELGRVVAFSGRVMGAAEQTAKYVNSPETALFRKGRVLYALDKARRSILDARVAILCEGQIDCIRCQRAGFSNVVASQGTALTEEHARLLRRYADSITLVLDADAAGEDAALRAAEVLQAEGLSIRIASLPPGHDPDSLIRQEGPAAFQRVLDQAQSALEFQIGVLRQRDDLASEAGLARATRAVLGTIARTPGAVQREQLLRRAAALLRISEQALRQDLVRQSRPPARAAPAATAPQPRHAVEEVALLEALVQHPELRDLIRQYLAPHHLSDPVCQTLLGLLLEPEAAPGALNVALHGASEECQRLAAQVQMAPQRLRDVEAPPLQAAQDLILVIRRKGLERRRVAAHQELERATGHLRERLRAECNQLTVDIKRLERKWDDDAKLILEL